MITVGVTGFPFSGKKTFMKLLAVISGLDKVEDRIIANVPDKRIERLVEIYSPKKVAPVKMEFVNLGDIDPSAKDKERNLVLSSIQNVDVVLIILRAFKSEVAPAVEGFEKPVEQLRYILEEFLMRDLAILENKIERFKTAKRKLTNVEELELKLVQKVKEYLEENESLEGFEISEDERKMIQGYALTAFKKKIAVVNLGDNEIKNGYDDKEKLLKLTAEKSISIVELPVKIAAEILELSDEEREMFLEEYGVKEFHIEDLMKEIFKATDMMVFFTAGEKEVHAWEVRKGATALEAAGTIHSDLARGFIRAEVFSFDDIDKEGSEKKLKEKGLIQVVGKDHVIKDGDIVYIRFNV